MAHVKKVIPRCYFYRASLERSYFDRTYRGEKSLHGRQCFAEFTLRPRAIFSSKDTRNAPVMVQDHRNKLLADKKRDKQRQLDLVAGCRLECVCV